LAVKSPLSRIWQRVFDQLRERGVPKEKLAEVYAPLGLDIGADAPAEIAVSVIAEILAVLRQRSGENLRGDVRHQRPL
jgi:xanthine dehydrogenase accessory factor